MARPLHAQLSLPALRSNLARARELAPDTQMLAVVKANAYGHGLMRLLPALEAADAVALVELDAAIALRVAGYLRRILLLEGFFTADELPEIAERRMAVVVHSEAQLRMLERSRLAKPIEVFIKINTGMNRLGIAPGDVVEMVERLNNCASVSVLRLMTRQQEISRRARSWWRDHGGDFDLLVTPTTAEPVTPDPTYGIPDSSRSPWIVPSSPCGPPARPRNCTTDARIWTGFPPAVQFLDWMCAGEMGKMSASIFHD
jgi:hypothetical protein